MPAFEILENEEMHVSNWMSKQFSQLPFCPSLFALNVN